MGGLKRYIRPWYGYIFLTVLLKLLGAMTELMIPSMLERIIDAVIPTGVILDIFLCGGVMLLLALATMGLNFGANRMSARSAGAITLEVRRDLFRKLSRLSARQLDDLTVPSAVSRLTSDTYNVNQMLARLQRLGIRGPVLLLGGLVCTLMLDWTMALVLLAMLPVICGVVYWVTKRSVPMYTKQQEVLDEMVLRGQENISGVRVIKALSKSDYEQGRFDKVNAVLARMDQKVNDLMGITNPVATVVLNLGLTAVVVMGAFRVNSGDMRPGVILASLNYFTIILNAMLGVTKIFVLTSKGQASALRVTQVLAMQEDMPVLPLPAAEGAGHLEFRNVGFSYNKVRDNVTDVSFRLERGQTLGILGATGSGKSTLIQLLLRFYDPDRGQILLDGRDIRSMDLKELRGKFGVVFQNDFILAGTLKENICYFRDIPDSRVAQAMEDAQGAEFVSGYPEGLDHTVAAQGSDLSGGQKQRLLIARALAGEPEILVLDDAASALDYRTDAALRRVLTTRYAGTTKIVVAQRVSTIQNADHILVLEDGAVIGAGNHRALMEQCPVYRQIAQTQMGEGAAYGQSGSD